MGEYFHILCHTCRKQHSPHLLKLREIFLNQHVAAEVGRFAAEHAGHILELRGDERTGNPAYPESVYVDYEFTTDRQVECLRKGIEE